MINLALAKILAVLARKSEKATLNEYEAQLYEASSRYLTSSLRFAEMTLQASLLKAERELDDEIDKLSA